MQYLKLTIEYNGSRYCGWAKQPGLATIEGQLEKAFQKLFGKSIKLVVAGRTDAGVHAVGQIVNCAVNSRFNLLQIEKALNAMLPNEILIKKVEKTTKDFHSRFSAKIREYRYLVYSGTNIPYYMRRYAWFIPQIVNINKMRKMAKKLIGVHDFARFSKKGKDTSKSTIRRMYQIKIEQKTFFKSPAENEKEKFIVFTFKANAFLHKMVRFLTGFLIAVGSGAIKPKDAELIIKGKGKISYKIAPPQGLTLKKVSY